MIDSSSLRPQVFSGSTEMSDDADFRRITHRLVHRRIYPRDQIWQEVRDAFNDDMDKCYKLKNSNLKDLKRYQKRNHRYRILNIELQTCQENWHLFEEVLQINSNKNAISNGLNQFREWGERAKDFQRKCSSKNEVPGVRENLLAENIKSHLEKRLNDDDQELEEKKNRVLLAIEQDIRDKHPVGPVGDHLIHDFFLVRLWKVMGIPRLLIQDPDVLSIKYKNDLKPWNPERETARCCDGENPFKDYVVEEGLYTGETVLHMAIVQEEIELVYTLLEAGADLSARAIGVFFQPKWRWPRRDDDLKLWEWIRAGLACLLLRTKSEVPYLPVAKRENRDYGCYYGEYPLSFAASVGSVDLCKLLYEVKVSRLGNDTLPRTQKEREWDQKVLKDDSEMWHFVNAHDSFGNTAMHMAVIHNRKEVIDFLAKCPEGKHSLELLNYEGFTPLTLAAKNGNVEIFKHILYSHLSHIAWTYGKVRMRITDLLQVDSFRIQVDDHFHNHETWKSALDIIVAHEVKAFAEEHIFKTLIDEKWKKFGRKFYLTYTVIPYTVILSILLTVIIIRGDEISSRLESNKFRCAQEADFWTFENFDSRTAVILQGILALIGAPWLCWKAYRHRRFYYADSDEDGKLSVKEMTAFVLKNIHSTLEISGAAALATGFAGRLLCHDELELDSTSIASVILFFNVLNVAMPFQVVGRLVITLFKMLVGDVLLILVVFLTLQTGLGGGVYLLCRRSAIHSDSDPQEPDWLGSNLGEAILRMGWVALGDDIGGITRYYPHCKAPGLVLTLFVVWVLLSSVLLLNLLIAMMGKTFKDDDKDTHAVWFFPFATVVLRYETMLSKKEKKKHRVGRAAGGIHKPGLNEKNNIMSKVGHEPSITGDVLQQHSDTERFYHVDVVNITEDDIIEIGEDVEEAILSKKAKAVRDEYKYHFHAAEQMMKGILEGVNSKRSNQDSTAASRKPSAAQVSHASTFASENPSESRPSNSQNRSHVSSAAGPSVSVVPLPGQAQEAIPDGGVPTRRFEDPPIESAMSRPLLRAPHSSVVRKLRDISLHESPGLQSRPLLRMPRSSVVRKLRNISLHESPGLQSLQRNLQNEFDQVSTGETANP